MERIPRKWDEKHLKFKKKKKKKMCKECEQTVHRKGNKNVSYTYGKIGLNLTYNQRNVN